MTIDNIVYVNDIPVIKDSGMYYGFIAEGKLVMSSTPYETFLEMVTGLLADTDKHIEVIDEMGFDDMNTKPEHSESDWFVAHRKTGKSVAGQTGSKYGDAYKKLIDTKIHDRYFHPDYTVTHKKDLKGSE